MKIENADKSDPCILLLKGWSVLPLYCSKAVQYVPALELLGDTTWNVVTKWHDVAKTKHPGQIRQTMNGLFS